MTFHPHPLKIVRPEDAPPLLTTPVEKKEILAESGLDYAVFLAFTPELARYEPRRFVEEILMGRLGVEELVIGYDHGFGRGRSGDAETLTRIGGELGFAAGGGCRAPGAGRRAAGDARAERESDSAAEKRPFSSKQ